MVEAIEIAEREQWSGIVIGNNAKQFSVGANLMNVGMLAMQNKFDDLNQAGQDFQDINMRVRTSKIPIVVATEVMYSGVAARYPCIAMQVSMLPSPI